jgi:CBS domain-containing protein
MKVRNLMRRIPRCARPGETLAIAARTMAEAGVGVLPVTDADDRVVGVITDRDVCCAVARGDRRPSELLVGTIASAPPLTCHASDDVSAALATMRAFAVRRLPVIDDDGRIDGILSLDEVVLAAHLLAENGSGAPVHSEVIETLQAIVRPAALAPTGASRVAAS